jgi:hypothetical protein
MANGDEGKIPFKRKRFMGVESLKNPHLNMHGELMVLGCQPYQIIFIGFLLPHVVSLVEFFQLRTSLLYVIAKLWVHMHMRVEGLGE